MPISPSTKTPRRHEGRRIQDKISQFFDADTAPAIICLSLGQKPIWYNTAAKQLLKKTKIIIQNIKSITGISISQLKQIKNSIKMNTTISVQSFSREKTFLIIGMPIQYKGKIYIELIIHDITDSTKLNNMIIRNQEQHNIFLTGLLTSSIIHSLAGKLTAISHGITYIKNQNIKKRSRLAYKDIIKGLSTIAAYSTDITFDKKTSPEPLLKKNMR